MTNEDLKRFYQTYENEDKKFGFVRYDKDGNIHSGDFNKYLSLERIAAYLYKVSFDSIPEYKELSNNVINGACSSFVKDGKLYRNLDWNYNNMASFIVQTKNFKGMAFINGLEDGNIDKEKVEQLPYHMIDGINTHNIMVSTHVLFNDWKYIGSGNKNISIMSIPYHILNELDSINNISTVLTPYLSNILIPDNLLNAEYLLQFLVTDGETTYAILPPTSKEGSWSITDISSNPKLTNFRWIDKTGTLLRNDEDLQTRPTGVERWNLIDFENTTLEDLRFTLAYESATRLSEFIGIDETTKESTDEELMEIYNLAHTAYENRTRDGKTWQTVYSVIYGNQTIESLYVQENYEIDYFEKPFIEINLSGESGTLTDRQFNLLMKYNSRAVLVLNKKRYYFVSDETDFRTYLNLNTPLIETLEHSTIYVNTNKGALNYKTWSLEIPEN